MRCPLPPELWARIAMFMRWFKRRRLLDRALTRIAYAPGAVGSRSYLDYAAGPVWRVALRHIPEPFTSLGAFALRKLPCGSRTVSRRADLEWVAGELAFKCELIHRTGRFIHSSARNVTMDQLDAWAPETPEDARALVRWAVRHGCSVSLLVCVRWMTPELVGHMYDLAGQPLNAEVAAEMAAAYAAGRDDVVRFFVRRAPCAFEYACRYGYLDIAVATAGVLVCSNGKPNKTLCDAIIAASVWGRCDVVKWLTSHLPDNFTGWPVDHALNLSCEYGYLDVAAWLVRYVDHKRVDNVYHTAAFNACRGGYTEIVEWALSQLTGSDIQVCSLVNQSLDFRQFDMAKYLISRFGCKIVYRCANFVGYFGNADFIRWLTTEVGTPAERFEVAGVIAHYCEDPSILEYLQHFISHHIDQCRRRPHTASD